MSNPVASTSNQKDVEFDKNFIARAGRMTVKQLKAELRLLQSEEHPLLSTVRRRVEASRQETEDRSHWLRTYSETKTKKEYETKEAAVEEEFETRLEAAMDDSRKRADDMERHTDHEFSVIDINKPVVVVPQFETNKKTLRGRGGQLIEPASYFNSNQNALKIPDTNFDLSFNEERIVEDLTKMNPNRGSSSKVYTVQIQKPRLVIENRTFKQGEDVTVSNGLYDHLLAKIDIVNEGLILLKGAHSWDTRQITATLNDLEVGRVVLAKQPRGKN